MQCIAIQHPAGTALGSDVALCSLVVFIARASEHMKAKNSQHMSVVLGSDFYPRFYFRGK